MKELAELETVSRGIEEGYVWGIFFSQVVCTTCPEPL